MEIFFFLVVMQLKATVAQWRFGESPRVGIWAATGTVLLMYGRRKGQSRNAAVILSFLSFYFFK